MHRFTKKNKKRTKKKKIIKMKPDKRVLTLRNNPMSPWLIIGGLASQSQTLVGVAIDSLDLWDIGFQQQQQQHAKNEHYSDWRHIFKKKEGGTVDLTGNQCVLFVHLAFFKSIFQMFCLQVQMCLLALTLLFGELNQQREWTLCWYFVIRAELL